MTSDRLWRGGDRVEVERVVSGGTAAYFPATVVSAPSMRKNLVWVEHEALVVRDSVRMKEYVTPTRLRPSPPRDLNRIFRAGDEVNVFIDSEGCWVRGNVTMALGNSRYIVEFYGGNRQAEVDVSDLRLHREWEDGVWVPSLFQQVNGLEPKLQKLRIKIRRREHQYEKGAIVEVRSEEEAYKGSWYCARILCILGDDKYSVEHLRFTRSYGDESIPLRDFVQGHNIRPVPPNQELTTVVSYESGDEVDAWFNKRWWIGRVSKVVGGGSKYSIYFNSTGEEQIILNFKLRPRKDWTNGQWVSPSKCYRPPLKKLKTCEREEETPLFNNGMMVEVRSDERGYEGSWYSAKIVSCLGGNRYTVEYQTLKTEDERELLKEEAKGSDIRPVPPSLIGSEVRRYELLEDVDAWFNDGWWSGRVYKRNSDCTRYGVYFKTTGEKLEFAYNELRPRQVWREGKWVVLLKNVKRKKKKIINSDKWLCRR